MCDRQWRETNSNKRKLLAFFGRIQKKYHKFLFNVAGQIIDVFFPSFCLMNFRFSLFLQLVSCLKRLNVLAFFPSFKGGFTRFIVLFCLVLCDRLDCCFGYCVCKLKIIDKSIPSLLSYAVTALVFSSLSFWQQRWRRNGARRKTLIDQTAALFSPGS